MDVAQWLDVLRSGRYHIENMTDGEIHELTAQLKSRNHEVQNSRKEMIEKLRKKLPALRKKVERVEAVLKADHKINFTVTITRKPSIKITNLFDLSDDTTYSVKIDGTSGKFAEEVENGIARLIAHDYNLEDLMFPTVAKAHAQFRDVRKIMINIVGETGFNRSDTHIYLKKAMTNES